MTRLIVKAGIERVNLFTADNYRIENMTVDSGGNEIDNVYALWRTDRYAIVPDCDYVRYCLERGEMLLLGEIDG